MKEYKGPLGKFKFDENYFRLETGQLIYVGGFTGGAIMCEIPEGILDCSYMFAGNTRLLIAPCLPKSCICANYMFMDCTNLQTLPDINEALMESNDFDYTTMFAGCEKLKRLCTDVDTKKQIDVYECACERSTDFKEHLKKMRLLVLAENKVKESDYVQMHKYRLRIAKKLKLDLNANKRFVELPKSLHHSLLLDNAQTMEEEAASKILNPPKARKDSIKSQQMNEQQNAGTSPEKISLEGKHV